jgi:hypothetical protein
LIDPNLRFVTPPLTTTLSTMHDDTADSPLEKTAPADVSEGIAVTPAASVTETNTSDISVGGARAAAASMDAPTEQHGTTDAPGEAHTLASGSLISTAASTFAEDASTQVEASAAAPATQDPGAVSSAASVSVDHYPA